MNASAERIRQDLGVLTNDIGVRLAGRRGERAAADYVLDQARHTGVEGWDESFPVKARDVQEEALEVCVGNSWTSFPCSLFSNTPGTDGQWLTGDLVVLEPTDYQRTDFGHLRGKAVVHLGCHIESRESYARLVDARPAFLLMVDTRYPGTTPLADGMFPAYTAALGAVPTLNVAYHDAWGWLERDATAARCRVVGGMVPASSQNVVIDLPGTDLTDEIVYASAHHDTQAGSPGADDNGTGVVGVLELMRLLQARPRRRAIRLISFGAEEQLSVGSAVYVRTHREDVTRRGRLMYNLDSYGSRMGWLQLYMNGPEELEPALRPWLHAQQVHYQTFHDVVPYADHFPFVAAGIPGIFHYRVNCDAGRFFHHRPDDDLTRVDVDVVVRHVTAVAGFLDAMAVADTLPFEPAIPDAQRPQVQRYWDDLFGGWGAETDT